MTDKKYTGLRFIFVGFIVAIFITLMMCGITIRNEIARLGNRQKGNTAGASRPVPSQPRRYPTPAEAASEAAAKPPAQEPPRLFNATDPVYIRFKILQGGWQAKGMDERGVWVLAVELRENPASPGQFYAFTTFNSIPIGPPAGGFGKTREEMLKNIRPLLPKSMILEGVPDLTSITFHLKKSVGTSDCPFTKLVLTQFGNAGLMSEWQFGQCRSGEGLMIRGLP